MDSAGDTREATSGARAIGAVERPQMLLRDQVLAKLREAIITGVYRPGERMLERELCDMLDVSRTSVREALRQLEIEELVSVGPRGRPFVTEISAEAAREIYEFRAVLETAAVEMFIARAPEAAFAELQRLSGAFADALDRGDIKARLQLKTAFYETLFGHAGNPPMHTVFIRVFNRIGFLRARSLRRVGQRGPAIGRTAGDRRPDRGARRAGLAGRDPAAHPFGGRSCRRLSGCRTGGCARWLTDSGRSRWLSTMTPRCSRPASPFRTAMAATST